MARYAGGLLNGGLINRGLLYLAGFGQKIICSMYCCEIVRYGFNQGVFCTPNLKKTPGFDQY